jgi:endonuclease/exonuclease/phosphatase family metal-dependent hydrolase
MTAHAAVPPPPPLKLLSFNIQVGLHTERYRHYLTRAWRHALPGRGQHAALDEIAALIRGHDFVAIQEADAGSFRTGFVDQMAYLAEAAGFPQHGLAVTRDFKPFARHALGWLSRWPATVIDEHALPGPIRGRRAVQLELSAPGNAARKLEVFVTHLSLGRRAQDRQLDYLVARASGDAPSVIVGDLNAEPERLRAHPALKAAGFWLPDITPATFPSWAPTRSLDHILLSPGLELARLEALPAARSDHLPLAAEIALAAPR